MFGYCGDDEFFSLLKCVARRQFNPTIPFPGFRCAAPRAIIGRSYGAKQQKRETNRFRDAVAYSKAKMSDTVIKAEYQTRERCLQKAFNMVIADFYTPLK